MVRFAGEEMDLASLMEDAAIRSDALAGLRPSDASGQLNEVMRLRTDKLMRMGGGGPVALGWDGTEPLEAYAF